MTILDTFKLNRNTHSEIGRFRIDTIRFKKLLENAKTLLDLFADGNEKLQGEYILDRHYVVSLIDQVIERLGMIVFDAVALSPESGAGLYHEYDIQKMAAERLISGQASGRGEEGGGEDSDSSSAVDPEYRLLSHVLSWFHGKGEKTVADLMKSAMAIGIQSIEKIKDMKKDIFYDEIWLKKSDSRIFLLDLWGRDRASLKQGPKSIDMFGSLPLKYFLKEAFDDTHPGDSQKEMGGEWLVVAGEHEMTLLSVNPNFSLRIDATASGYEASDYIFVSIDNRLDPDKIIPKWFHKEKHGSGYFCWQFDVSSEAIEEGLIAIGRKIFG